MAIRAGHIVYSDARSKTGIVVRVNAPYCDVFWFPDQDKTAHGAYNAQRNTVQVIIPSGVEAHVPLDHLEVRV